ncbi:DUF3592 domain-containing protein [Saccharopolyspora taberi]|uniref:DUF3592 domain-containing protein n=1 Tax=Saccharopolyspora taberi TaxID=60895 RepID=A0ABN3V997_9PSEU
MNAVVTGAFLVLLPAIILALVGWETRVRLRLRRSGVTARGRVVGHVSRTDGMDEPVLRFVDRRGRYVDFRPQRGAFGSFAPVGMEADLVYLENDPDTARLASDVRGRYWSLLVAAPCAGVMLLGVLVLAGVLPQGTRSIPSGSPVKGVFGLVNLVIGLLMVGGGCWWFWRLLLRYRDGHTTTGTVVRRSSQNQGRDLAVVEFLDLHHRRIQLVSRAVSRKVGTRVPVRYPAERPGKGVAGSLARNARSAAVLFLLGLATAAVGVAMLA